MTVKNSKFDHEFFYSDDFNELGISKQKYTKEQAIEFARKYFGLGKHPCYLALSEMWARHRVGRGLNGDCCSGWFLEDYEGNRSCPCYAIFMVETENIKFFKEHHKEYEYILVNVGLQKSN